MVFIISIYGTYLQIFKYPDYIIKKKNVQSINNLHDAAVDNRMKAIQMRDGDV